MKSPQNANGLKAPILYLDSSDYLNFENGNHKEILCEIIRLRDGGYVVPCFSWLTVYETIKPANADHLENRRRRAAMISEICGPNCVPHLQDVSKELIIRKDGVWVPESVRVRLSPKSVRKSLSEAAAEKIKEIGGLNRKQRRGLLAKNSIREALANLDEGVLDDLTEFAGVPLPREMIEQRYAERLLKGQLSPKKFSDAFTNWLIDLEKFAILANSYSDEPEKVLEPIKPALSELNTSIKEIIDQVEDLRQKTRSKKEEASILAKDLKALGILTPELKRTLKIKPLEIERDTFKVSDVIRRRRPGLGMIERSDYFDHYLYKLFRGEFRFLDSDIPDLLHFIYLDRVDLMRCDAKMASIFRELPHFRSRMVPSIGEIPDRILGHWQQ